MQKIVGIDGTRLSGPFKGIMLTTIGLDGNNGSFLISYAIIDKENKSSWIYLFTFLRVLESVLIIATRLSF